LEDSTGHGHDNDAASVNSDMSGSDASFLDEENSLKIQFHNGNTAEAMDKRKFGTDSQEEYWTTNEDLWWPMDASVQDESFEEQDRGKQEFSKHESLENNFESRIQAEINSIRDIVPWETISSVSPTFSVQTSSMSINYETLFEKLWLTLFSSSCPQEIKLNQ